jgi:hypothetical protein
MGGHQVAARRGVRVTLTAVPGTGGPRRSRGWREALRREPVGRGETPAVPLSMCLRGEIVLNMGSPVPMSFMSSSREPTPHS